MAVSDVLQFLDASLYNATGLVFVALGALVAIRFLGFPDLTIDGSFTLGAALYALSIRAGMPAPLGLAAALLGGCSAGFTTGTANQFLKLGKIISSILVMLFLLVATPYAARGTTIGLLNYDDLLSRVGALDRSITASLLGPVPFSLHPAFIGLVAGVSAAVSFTMWRLFRSRIGAEARYVGSATSPQLVSPARRSWLLCFGLAAANGLVGLGGAIEAQRRGGFSHTMGIGVVLTGLAILIVGESIVKTRKRRDYLRVGEGIGAVVAGVVFYSFGVQLLLGLIGVVGRQGAAGPLVDVRLLTTLMLLALLAYAAKRHPNSARLF